MILDKSGDDSIGVKLELTNYDNDDSNTNDNVITILHFNDCYNIESGPKSSGAAGFLTAINEFRHLDPIILFSGDIISPSFISTFTKGQQMIPVLNDIGVNCAVFGNHEFDYGVDNLIEFAKQTSFPWLLSNVIDKETSTQLGNGQLYHVIEKCGIKFGLIGLIEEEWLSTLSTVDSDGLIYEDFVEKGHELAKMLKSEPHNVDYVIALTHFRRPNDIRLADNVDEIDLILGGHDHDYEVIKRPKCYIIKSGTDFREFSKISLKRIEGKICSIVDSDIERIECLDYKPDEELKGKLDKFVKSIDEKMGKVLGQFSCELDGRFSSIRNYESNLGNFVTDIMLASTHADLAILNSGTLRSDRIHPKGDFTMRDLFNILGYIDPITVLDATGDQIWRALENGVSLWPRLEGRFPQVSGCSFAFDPTKPAMQRINPQDISIGDEVLQLDKRYKLTTKDYLAAGKDGYDVFKECIVLVPGDESPDLTTSILNHFEAIQIIKSKRPTAHRQSLICLSRNSIRKLLHQSSSESAPTSSRNLRTNISPTCSLSFDIGRKEPVYEQREDDQDSQQQNLNADDNNNAGMNLGDEGFGLMEQRVDGNNDDHDPNLSPSKSPPVRQPKQKIVSSTPSRNDGQNSDDEDSVSDKFNTPETRIVLHHAPPTRSKRLMSLDEMEYEQCKLCPRLEGRIRVIGHDRGQFTHHF